MQGEGASSTTLPVAVTMGCPAGVGPEVVLKALADEKLDVPCVVVGDAGVLEQGAKALGLTLDIERWHPGQAVTREKDKISCLDVTNLSPDDFSPGVPTALTGKASYKYILEAVKLCLKSTACAMATAPISKTGLRLSGVEFPGHTEILANLTGTGDFLMMMAGKRLRVTLCTIHVALRKVPELLDIETVFKTIRMTWKALKVDFDLKNPAIGVCGLNPHAGEGGMFGSEEEEIIAPACKKAKEEGMEVTGPLPPDTIFYHAAGGGFDAVVCMYHDQGLIPFKLLHFRDGVNVTCGLPIVRTSVDHGTAYDIAWQGKADHESMSAAIVLAKKIYENRQKNRG